MNNTSEKKKFNLFFNDADADIIVRARDGSLFKLHKIILKRVSSIFEDTFDIGTPQSPSIVDDRDTVDGIAVVDLTEDERTLEILFRLCYPMSSPELATLEDVAQVLKASMKYEMELISDHTRKLWPSIAATDPLRAFAIACIMNLRTEATLAARLTLERDIWPLQPPLAAELKLISADTIIRLQHYHRRCGSAAHRCASDPQRCAQVYDSASCSHCQGKGSAGTQGIRMRDWFANYTRRAASALVVRPSSSTVTNELLFVESMYEAYKSAESMCDISTHCFGIMKQAVVLFAKEIDQAISEVDLELDL